MNKIIIAMCICLSLALPVFADEVKELELEKALRETEMSLYMTQSELLKYMYAERQKMVAEINEKLKELKKEKK